MGSYGTSAWGEARFTDDIEGGSDKHLRDSAGVLAIQGDCVDRDYIDQWSNHFGLTEIWNAILKRVDDVYGKNG